MATAAIITAGKITSGLNVKSAAPRPERNFQGQDRNQDRNQDRGFQGQDRNQERTYQDRNPERTYQDRQPYQERQSQNRDPDSRGNGSRGGGRREYREPRPLIPDNEAALPAFITAPVRLQPEVHIESAGDEGLPRTMMQPDAEREADNYLLRPRRRRRKAEGPNEDFRGEATATDPVGE